MREEAVSKLLEEAHEVVTTRLDSLTASSALLDVQPRRHTQRKEQSGDISILIMMRYIVMTAALTPVRSGDFDATSTMVNC